MDSALNQARKLLQKNEELLSYLSCSLETFVYRVVPRPGVLILTDKRLFFYGPDITGNALFEEYSYDKISLVKEEKNIFGSKILIKYDNEWVKIKYIQSKDPSAFVQKIKETI